MKPLKKNLFASKALSRSSSKSAAARERCSRKYCLFAKRNGKSFLVKCMSFVSEATEIHAQSLPITSSLKAAVAALDLSSVPEQVRELVKLISSISLQPYRSLQVPAELNIAWEVLQGTLQASGDAELIALLSSLRSMASLLHNFLVATLDFPDQVTAAVANIVEGWSLRSLRRPDANSRLAAARQAFHIDESKKRWKVYKAEAKISDVIFLAFLGRKLSKAIRVAAKLLRAFRGLLPAQAAVAGAVLGATAHAILITFSIFADIEWRAKTANTSIKNVLKEGGFLSDVKPHVLRGDRTEVFACCSALLLIITAYSVPMSLVGSRQAKIFLNLRTEIVNLTRWSASASVKITAFALQTRPELLRGLLRTGFLLTIKDIPLENGSTYAVVSKPKLLRQHLQLRLRRGTSYVALAAHEGPEVPSEDSLTRARYLLKNTMADCLQEEERAQVIYSIAKGFGRVAVLKVSYALGQELRERNSREHFAVLLLLFRTRAEADELPVLDLS